VTPVSNIITESKVPNIFKYFIFVSPGLQHL